ncbi:NADPH-dependent FMN reductase [Actinophytocola sp.]|uniref:NADPH-dependent FMN reductase n=1 Tax=Actinophytocola sp. TaxID=1872138 RepID=UPI00389B2CBD
MARDALRVLVINSSVRDGRFGPTAARWLLGQLADRADLTADYLDLADHPLPLRISRQPDADAERVLSEVTPRLERAEAFVVVTPEYNHSFPASLKNLIDWHYTQWRAKPVTFVSYGGLAGGLRSVEHLRQVFAELHAVTTRDVVSFHNAWEQFDDNGEPVDPTGPATAAKTMLDQLAWWGFALRDARAARPYDG